MRSSQITEPGNIKIASIKSTLAVDYWECSDQDRIMPEYQVTEKRKKYSIIFRCSPILLKKYKIKCITLSKIQQLKYFIN